MDESLDKREHAKKMFDQRWDHMKYLPPQILLDLARNEAASREWRKAATQLLIDHHYPQANHPDLGLLRLEIEQEYHAKNDVRAVVESAIESEIPDHTPELSASVTTASLQQDDVVENVRNPLALNDDALTGQ